VSFFSILPQTPHIFKALHDVFLGAVVLHAKAHFISFRDREKGYAHGVKTRAKALFGLNSEIGKFSIFNPIFWHKFTSLNSISHKSRKIA
jgi:hypothetical protein